MNVPNRRVREPPVEPSGPPPSAAPAPPRPAPPWLARLRTAGGVALVVGVSIAVAWAARRHLLTSSRFAVSDVQVAGAERRPTDTLVAESGVALGANVFAVDLDAARARLLADPWIAEASFARRLPGTILVQVVERRAAVLVTLGDVFLATSEGDPFKKLEPGDPVDLPLVTGLTAEAFTADRDGSMRTVRRAIDLAAEYDRSTLARHSPLQEVHVTSDGGYAIVVGKSATQLVLGGPPFRRKLEQAARVVAELDKRGAKADAIMLDNDARPERVVVRMR